MRKPSDIPKEEWKEMRDGYMIKLLHLVEKLRAVVDEGPESTAELRHKADLYYTNIQRVGNAFPYLEIPLPALVQVLHLAEMMERTLRMHEPEAPTIVKKVTDVYTQIRQAAFDVNYCNGYLQRCSQ